jgi:hypothetical protein
MVRDDHMQVFPVHTILARHLSENSDCVVDLFESMDEESDAPLKPEIIDAMRQLLSKLELKQKRKLLIRVASSGDAGRKAVEKIVGDAKTLASTLGFETVAINHTPRR